MAVRDDAAARTSYERARGGVAALLRADPRARRGCAQARRTRSRPDVVARGILRTAVRWRQSAGLGRSVRRAVPLSRLGWPRGGRGVCRADAGECGTARCAELCRIDDALRFVR